jgi:hypothetical protein
MKRIENLGQKVILFHKGEGEWISFDLFAHKNMVTQALSEVKDEIYQVDCDYVILFLTEFPDYVYLGSEDFGHIYEGNVAIFDFLLELISKFGWKKIDWEE